MACGASLSASSAPPSSPLKPLAATTARPSSPLPTWAAAYPSTRSEDTKDTLFGTEVRDPYRWLEDAKSAEVQTWMKTQDELAREKLAALPERPAIAARLKELAYVDAQSAPTVVGGRLFYSRRSGKQEKEVFCWRQGKAGAEHVLLDPNAWSADGSVSLHSTSVSWDGKLVAYTVSENNSDDATLHVMEVATGKERARDAIPGARYAYASWTPRSDGFYYTWLPTDPKIPEDQRPGFQEARYHALGTDPAKDVVVHEHTGDPAVYQSVWITKDGRWLVLDTGRWNANDLYVRDTRSPSKDWKPLAIGKDATYDVRSFGGRFFVYTNEGAPKYRVFAVDPAHLAREAWREIVPERPDATLEGMQILGGKLALTYMKDVTSRIELHDLDGRAFRTLALPGLGTAWISGANDQDEAFWGYETFNNPLELHVTSIANGGDALWFKLNVPVDPSAYAVDQVFFMSKDGTRVPMFVVRSKSFPRDGSAPAMVTGYGGFNLAEQPIFNNGIFPWLERGGIYVDVNLRGGGEYGETWHRAGMRHAKQNVFDDFAAAAEALVKERYTSPDRMVIEGGSNGGLLVGAALTQRPDLYRAVICEVPLLDMVRYAQFGAGRTWVDEYGTADNEEDFRTLFAYSPYHHVTSGTRYPSVLMDSADSDDRVDPMHARKLVAQLQAASTGGPVLLRIERHAGHEGGDMVSAWVDRVADHYAFALAEIRKTGGAMVP